MNAQKSKTLFSSLEFKQRPESHFLVLQFCFHKGRRSSRKRKSFWATALFWASYAGCCSGRSYSFIFTLHLVPTQKCTDAMAAPAAHSFDLENLNIYAQCVRVYCVYYSSTRSAFVLLLEMAVGRLRTIIHLGTGKAKKKLLVDQLNANYVEGAMQLQLALMNAA